ncbi:MAG TPA: hypothetical protein VMR54_10040 [Thermoanaerobaculia bacterium]|nr:hypothetical protein [Thermoanaerobaculia bacterium]
MTRLSEFVPPVEVSRLLLAGLVGAGALVSVCSGGQLSHFAGGFAVGAGSVFVVSFLKARRPPVGGGTRPGETP